ncbi:MAG: lytic murein transglycosylase B [Gammaproteobacteria bacterium]|jgi:membrane-bound lytic murein transglycosylase B|nr:lytic murein transglycosylase B [Gammaproteobacteria bacterium]MDP6695604.1 lytic murein transglycosylase B [Gammaproteobacteria bacterium]MDP7041396.1 lytic murein transglycosylase B [Gammaproteobacteria bacterium]
MKGIFHFAEQARCIQFGLLATLLIPMSAWSVDVQRDDVRQFVNELALEYDFDPAFVEEVLAESEVQQSILDAISRPAERVKPWHEYRAIFITPERIRAGVKFFAEHKETLRKIEQDTGVPPSMILGIVGVESYFGRRTGNYRVVDALATLGFDYPPRAKFFRSELGHAFRLAREENMDLLELKGSYAGAMGPPQFIPSSYRNFAVDGNGDGQRDLLNNWHDILASIANYFAVHKWEGGAPVATLATVGENITKLPLNEGLKPDSTVGTLSDTGVFFPTDLDCDEVAGLWVLDGEDGDEYWVGFNNLYVITRYNRSVMYALAAWELGDSIVREANL